MEGLFDRWRAADPEERRRIEAEVKAEAEAMQAQAEALDGLVTRMEGEARVY